MKRLVAPVLGMLLILLGQGVALGQSPSGPTIALQSTFPVANPPDQFQLVEQVLDFPPGAWTLAHSHGGLVFVTVAQGTIAQFSDGKETSYKAGATWTETAGHVHQAGNTTPAPARTLVTFLLPPGAQQTTQQQLADARTSTVKTAAKLVKFDVPAVARPFDVVQMELNFAPGQWMASQAYGGPAFVMALEGELTLRANGADKSVKAGEGASENAGAFFQLGNAGTGNASAFVTVLLPKRAALSTLESQTKAPATLPQTGGDLAMPLGVVLISALLLVGGAVLWRKSAARVS